MKLTKQKLKQIIKEEMSKALNEADESEYDIDLRDYGVETDDDPDEAFAELAHRITTVGTRSVRYGLASDQQIELGREAEAIFPAVQGALLNGLRDISPELRGHLIDLIILNLEHIAEIEKGLRK